MYLVSGNSPVGLVNEPYFEATSLLLRENLLDVSRLSPSTPFTNSSSACSCWLFSETSSGYGRAWAVMTCDLFAWTREFVFVFQHVFFALAGRILRIRPI